MPTPDQVRMPPPIQSKGVERLNKLSEMLGQGPSLTKATPWPSSDVMVLDARMTELEKEVREIRRLIEPIPSLILTGRQVLLEFEQLKKRTA